MHDAGRIVTMLILAGLNVWAETCPTEIPQPQITIKNPVPLNLACTFAEIAGHDEPMNNHDEPHYPITYTVGLSGSGSKHTITLPMRYSIATQNTIPLPMRYVVAGEAA